MIDKVAAVSPEQGKSIVDDYVADRATADGVQSEHDRQRALRRAVAYYAKKNGLEAIVIEGDGVAKKQMWDAIEARANEMYIEDGGRDLPQNKHPRTRQQRLFDAAHELICGPQTTEDGNGAGKTRRASTRPRIVIGLSIDKLVGRDPAAVATQHGLGLIADSVVADYAEHGDIMAALFDRTGEPLWLGRLKRYASTSQLIALILRDKGCVLCGADHTRCQAHHRMPWHAPGKGPTDLDQLVLLCTPCHQQLHGDEQTIHRDHTGTWRTRPATPNEIAPTHNKPNRNHPQQE